MTKLSLFNSDMLKSISGECQCCLEKSDYLKNMSTQYPYKGEMDIYGSMLFETLSIRVLDINPNALICNTCIDKLRDVLTFKRMVEGNLKNFENRTHTKVSETENDGVQLNIKFVNKEGKENEHNLEEFKNSNSDNMLEKAIKRTKENLELLESTLKEGETIESLLISEHSPKIKADISLDKKARKRFLAKRQYENDLPYKIEKADRICKLCSKEFSSYFFLVQHMTEHFPNHICNICGKLFAMRRLLNRHIHKIHNARVIQCPICNSEVKEGNMRRHNMKHTGVKAYPCRYCPEKFDGYLYQIRHMIKEHNYQHKKIQCGVCRKVFEISSQLTLHMKRVHSDERKHICVECDKPFRTKNELKRHMVKHTQIRDYKCEICHKDYLSKWALNSHIKKHFDI